MHRRAEQRRVNGFSAPVFTNRCSARRHKWPNLPKNISLLPLCLECDNVLYHSLVEFGKLKKASGPLPGLNPNFPLPDLWPDRVVIRHEPVTKRIKAATLIQCRAVPHRFASASSAPVLLARADARGSTG